ncbi:unnamed protein product [Echinostoma caproni]|uniref:Prophage protein n=1 Tax=Echinostoma caproni TaxID=27848 RepID=A0A183B170_9TREM|nr:unnamed protein product [Echinostoma caproni]
MQNCSIVPNHLKYRSDLDALHTLESEMQTAWATEADRIEKRNREATFDEHADAWATEADRIEKRNGEATFDELAQFIGCQSRIANGRFGQLARESIRTAMLSTNFTPS